MRPGEWAGLIALFLVTLFLIVAMAAIFHLATSLPPLP